MKTIREYKRIARGRLSGNWTPGVLATLLLFAIFWFFYCCNILPYFVQLPLASIFCINGASFLTTLLLVNPLDLGLQNAFRVFYERGDDRISANMFSTGFSNYWHKVGGLFLVWLKVVLWMFLLIIPGIIMAIAYTMTPYILEEHPEIDVWEASNRSREMMKGHKAKFFWLTLSYIGWFLLGVLTFGIAMFWVIPYYQTATAAFYNDLKAEQGEEAVTE